MLWAILNKSWRQHPTKHQLYGHLPSITKTIQVRWTRYAGHCWRRRDKLISDVLLWTPTYGRAKAGRPAWTYIQQLCADTGCSPEDLPEAMNDREKWRERVRDISAGSTTWWWWWYRNSVSSIFPLCMKLNVLKKTTNNSVALRFFAHTPMIWQILRISEAVKQFLQKPFWFFLRMFLISRQIWFRSRTL